MLLEHSGTVDGRSSARSSGARRRSDRCQRWITRSAVLRWLQAAQETGTSTQRQETPASARGDVAQAGGHAMERSAHQCIIIIIIIITM